MNLGAYKRYCEFGGKEQREEPRVREFREFGTASLRGIAVNIFNMNSAVYLEINKSQIFRPSMNKLCH